METVKFKKSFTQKELNSWRVPGCAPIVTIDTLLKEVNPNYLSITSGGFDPIHPGHISCMVEAKKNNKLLAVIVNGDRFVSKKHGKPFQNLKTRCQVVSGISCVDFVIPYEAEDDDDLTVCEPLAEIKPMVFVKGGDRVDAKTIPEWDICDDLDIKVVTGAGLPKHWSSSNVLEEWGKFWISGKS